MWVFIFAIASAYVEAPYLDVNFFIKYDRVYSYIEEEHNQIEIDMSLELMPYIEYEDFLIDREVIAHYDIEKTIELPSDFNYNDIGVLQIEMYYSDIELIFSYDGLTINFNANIYYYILDRSYSTLAYIVEYWNVSKFIEQNIEYPFYILIPSTNGYITIERDIREYTNEEIYDLGYDDGYRDGERDGHENGYEDGYRDGEYVGSMTQPIFKLFNAVFRSIDTVLQTEVLPGIKLWYIVSIPLVFLIIQFFINLWR